MNRLLCLRTWFQIQNGLIGTEQNSKTGGGKCDYSSKTTGLWRLTIGSQQS